MNSTTTRFQAALRYFALVPLIAVGLLSIIATGGGGGGSSAPPPSPIDPFGLRAAENFNFHQIDASTGTATLISTLSEPNSGLAFDRNTDTLYGTGFGRLHIIDPVTGAFTTVGDLGFPRVVGLAFDPNTNTLYGTDTFSFDFITIDPATGAGTFVADIFVRVPGLAFDPNTNTLYGADTVRNQLITIDPATGAVTVVGDLGFPFVQRVNGLAFDPTTNTLYGTDIITLKLITIDPATGAGTVVGSTGVPMEGLAFR